MADPVYRYRSLERPETIAPGDIVCLDDGSFEEAGEVTTGDVLVSVQLARDPKRSVTFTRGTRVRFLRPDIAPEDR